MLNSFRRLIEAGIPRGGLERAFLAFDYECKFIYVIMLPIYTNVNPGFTFVRFLNYRSSGDFHSRK